MKMTRDRWIGVAMIMPSILLIGLFVYGFIGQTAYSSLTNWEGLAVNPKIDFIGLQNFSDLFNSLLNSRFRGDLVNTVFFTIFFLAACLTLGLLLAILIDQKIRGESIFRTIFLFPMALSFVVTGTVWRWLFSPRSGLNTLPTVFGGQALTIPWFTDRTKVLQFQWGDLPLYIGIIVGLITFGYVTWAWGKRRNRSALIGSVIGFSLTGVLIASRLTNPMDGAATGVFGLNIAIFSIVIAATWQMAGYTMAMYLAGLRGIPEELREAARVDGCSELQVYRFVVFPLLQPITLSAVIILGHISLKIFDLVFVMAGESNLFVDVPGINMYVTAFRGNRFGVGSAMAVIMLIMVAVIIIPYLWTTFRQEAKK
jgi:glucose/mannose transport system permease protein